MLQKEDKLKKVGRKRVHAKIVLSVVVEMDSDLTVDDVIKNRTEFLAEPKDSHGGTVIAMRIQSVEEVPRFKASVTND